MNGKRAFAFLNKMGFVRVGGTKEELVCAEMINEELSLIGEKGLIEPFEVNGYNIKTARFEVLEPNYKEYTVTAYGCCGSTEESGLEGEFYYLTSESEVDLENAKGKIVLINGAMSRKLYKKLVEVGIIGFVTYNGDLNVAVKDNDIAKKELRDSLREIKILPCVNMLVHDAVELVLSEPKKVRMTVIQDEYKNESRNVLAEIKGTTKPEEVIVLTAHYDSVEYSTGVYDNGAGSVILLEAYRYFMENKPNRTIKFIWCGSEERGLLGSKAWVLKHEEELKKIKLNINCDVAGPVLGRNWIIVTGNREMMAFCKALGNEIGFPADYRKDIYSSDCIPFADKGIPAINVTRFGGAGTAFIHCRHDVIKYLDWKNLEQTGDYLIKLIEKYDKCLYSPFELKVDDDVKESVDKYLFKKE